MKSISMTTLLWPLLGVAIIATELSLASTTSIDVVSYSAGKDEICLTVDHTPKKGEVLKASLKKLIMMRDYYGNSDTEQYCTVVFSPSDKKQMTEKKASASSDRCQKLWEIKSTKQIEIRIVKDHLCEIL